MTTRNQIREIKPTENQQITMTEIKPTNETTVSTSHESFSTLLVDLIDFTHCEEDPKNCYTVGDFILEAGSRFIWRRFELEDDHLAYNRQGFARKCLTEDLLFLLPYRIQEAVPRNPETIREAFEKTERFPAWQQTRWVMPIARDGGYWLFDLESGRTSDPRCMTEDETALIKRMKDHLALGGEL